MIANNLVDGKYILSTLGEWIKQTNRLNLIWVSKVKSLIYYNSVNFQIVANDLIDDRYILLTLGGRMIYPENDVVCLYGVN